MPPRAQPAQPQHVAQIDGLRAVAILMVFVHHAFSVPQLWAGVDLFFILSGFLITGILIRDTAPQADGKPRFSFSELAGRFYFRRAQRILPAYCIFMLAAVPLMPVAWNRLWPYYTFFAQNVPVAFRWIPPNALDPLWSLGVENQFYLLWPLVVFFLPRKWLAPGMVALLLGEPVLRYFATPYFATPSAIYALTPFRLDALAAGALFALMLPKLEKTNGSAKFMRRLGQFAILLGAAVLLAMTAHYPWFRRTSNAPAYNSLIYSLNIAILGGLFLWAWFSRGPLGKVLSHPVLAWLGRISYMFYLSHLFLLYAAGLLVRRLAMMFGATHLRAEHLLGVALGFALTCGFSTLSWIAIEKPALNYRRKHKPSKQEIANAQAAA